MLSLGMRGDSCRQLPQLRGGSSASSSQEGSSEGEECSSEGEECSRQDRPRPMGPQGAGGQEGE